MFRTKLLAAVLVLAACGRPAAQPPRPDRPELGPAALRMRGAGAQGQVPSGDYLCRLRDPDHPTADGQPYGALQIRREAYRLRLETGPVLSGQLHATPAGQLMWNGPLGPIDAAPRRISRGRITAADDVLTLVLDFSPALPGPNPTTQVLCRLTVGSDI